MAFVVGDCGVVLLVDGVLCLLVWCLLWCSFNSVVHGYCIYYVCLWFVNLRCLCLSLLDLGFSLGCFAVERVGAY